jgi:YidC/Oxa1 family membrane protein insertase
MSTEQRALLATGLVIVIFVVYQSFFIDPHVPAPPTEDTPSVREAGEPAPPAPVTSPAMAPDAGRSRPAAEPERDVTIDTPLIRAVITTRGGTLKSWQLKQYRLEDGSPVELVAPQEGPWGPLLVWSGGLEGAARLDFVPDTERLELRGRDDEGALMLRSRAKGPVRLTKRLAFRGDSYRVGVELEWENTTRGPVAVAPELAWGPGFHGSPEKAHSRPQPPMSLVDGRRIADSIDKLQGAATHSGAVSWTALHDLYFAAALLPETRGPAARVLKDPSGQPMVSLVAPAQTLQPGARATQRFAVYAGPKELDRLRAASQDLEGLVDLGWFDFLARPALYLLRFLYRYTGNYGVAIILVTILQKVAFHPLTAKSLRSMQAMQALQPKIAAVQERYKNNPQKKQQEMMELYKKHGVNPMGGCLPMLLQIPIFIALYNALSSSVEMWRASFLWIKDLSRPDALFALDIWGLKDYPFNLLALLMGATMFLQQKMAPAVGDPRQAKLMLYLMPTMFTFMFWTFPSGLVLYWLVNNVLQIGQQYWLERRGVLKPREADKAS